MAHQKSMEALYCHKDRKDHQYEKGYVCHIFTTKGLAIKALIPKDKSTNARFYKKKVWRKLVKFYQKCRPMNICGIYLSSHKARSMTSFLKEQGDYFLEHPPYSPDIAPCDFFLSPRLKKNLAGRKHTSRQKLGAATFYLLRVVPEKNIWESLQGLD